MSHRPILIRAATVAPMDRPPIRDGAVYCVNGRIAAVGAIADVRKNLPRHDEVDLGHAVLLPGLVNAHTHLELSDLESGATCVGTFGEWILSIGRRAGRSEADFPQRVRTSVANGARQCLRFGVTAVGDITAQPAITRAALRGVPLRVVSYGEILGLGKAINRIEPGLSAALEPEPPDGNLIVALSPHAPYTIDEPTFRECVTIARQRGIRLATHLAETADEEIFLRERTGVFRNIWEKLGTWSDDVQTFAASPVAFARAIGLLDLPSAIVAHVNYCDDDDLSMLAAGRASVVFCPRTHAFFSHARHRWREMLARGVNVAVGSDSCASSPDLNIVDDLRLLWRRVGHTMDSFTLWELITTNAAHAIGLNAERGSISVGKHASLAAFAYVGDVDPLGAVLDDPSALPIAVYVEGKRM